MDYLNYKSAISVLVCFNDSISVKLNTPSGYNWFIEPFCDVNIYGFLSIYCLESSIYFMDLKIDFLIKFFTSMFCIIPIMNCFSVSTKICVKAQNN